MSNAIEIDGKSLHPIKEAAVLVSYSRDYITRLAREEKIIATNVGRQWFVSIDSLKAYVEASAMEQDIRKKQLSEERKKEREIREVTDKQNTLHIKRANSLHVRAVAVASLVLSFGLLGGFVTHQFVSFSDTQQAQISASEVYVSPVTESVVQEAQTPAVENDLVTIESAREIKKLGDVSNGILLLPSMGPSTPEEMFSDDVVVMNLPDGTKAVVQVDESGNVTGNRVPFVTVPVEQSDI